MPEPTDDQVAYDRRVRRALADDAREEQREAAYAGLLDAAERLLLQPTARREQALRLAIDAVRAAERGTDEGETEDPKTQDP